MSRLYLLVYLLTYILSVVSVYFLDPPKGLLDYEVGFRPPRHPECLFLCHLPHPPLSVRSFFRVRPTSEISPLCGVSVPSLHFTPTLHGLGYPGTVGDVLITTKRVSFTVGNSHDSLSMSHYTSLNVRPMFIVYPTSTHSYLSFPVRSRL